MKLKFPIIAALFFLFFFSKNDLYGQKDKTQSVRTRIFTPEEELAGFRLLPGFVIELVASERDSVVNPVDLTFDDAGRLWTQTARMYPLDPISDIKWNDLLKLMDDPVAQKNHPAFKRILDLYQGKTKGSDKILVLSGLYDKQKVKTTVWADGLTIPMSILPYKNGAYVAQGSELFFLEDKNHDGKADDRVPLFTGFGFTDTHTMAHVLVRGPGDWINFSQGALNKGEVVSLQSAAKLKIDYSKIVRFSLDAKKIELVSNGLNNIWGFQLRGNGQWYGSEANDLGYSVTPIEPGSGFPGIGNEHLRSYQPFVPPLHQFRVGGTGISGTAFSDDLSGSFPEEFRNVAFLANPITSTINAVQIIRNADGSISSKHLPDLLTSDDDWFRPVNMEFGPDGCLYIADWYNKIVSHNELPTTHPDRDKTHGRIWRIRHVSQQPRLIPDLYTVPADALPAHLKSPSIWEKRAAWHQISDRPASETAGLAPQLIALAGDAGQDETTRIHALWSLEAIKQFDKQLVETLLDAGSPDLKREAIRSLVSFSLTPAERANVLKTLIDDPDPQIRSQVVRTLSEAGEADQSVIELLVKACKPELQGDALGGPYERKFERYLARKALEQYASQLHDYTSQPVAPDVPVVNILWAIQALPVARKEAAFIKFWPQSKIDRLDESTFVSMSSMLGNQEIYNLMKPVLQNPANAGNYVRFALQNQAQVQSPELAALMVSPVETLLKGKNPPDIDLALDAAGRFKLGLSNLIAPLVTDGTPDNTLKLALKALEVDAKVNEPVFSKLVTNNKIGFKGRLAALHTLAKTNALLAQNLLSKWAPELSTHEKAELTNVLSGSKQGADLLMIVYEKKLIGADAFDLSAAERVSNAGRSDARRDQVLAVVRKREEEKKAAFKGKLARFMAIADKNQGSAENGKVLFQTCLLCHQVGNTGQTIAPALDGSAARENEALITAILDPDAAMESGYAVYRIAKKDGSSVEGYLVNKDNRGSTIAFMGGSKVFVPVSLIKNEGFLGGRSFMVKGLTDNYSDTQVADLLTYIKTLK